MNIKPRTRFAPSPTGKLHIGGLRTAIYAFALAKHDEGDFILRIEDTDKKRESEGGVGEIKNILEMFKINWDEFYIQSERLNLYSDAAKKLVEEGYAFYCECEGKNVKEKGYSSQLRDGCRDKGLKSGAIKLKVPENETVSFRDFILKDEVSWQTAVVFDATLLKSDGYPTYHLASVVDDHQMKITHVLRGHDWLPSTPIHLLVYKYLNYDVPEIGHLTDILDPEGGKLSKRKGSVSVEGLLGEGYLPEALFNFVILLGWAPKDNTEIFDLDGFVKSFNSDGFQKSNPVFDRKKLDWFNGHYIRQKSNDDLAALLKPYIPTKIGEGILDKIIPLVKDRLTKLSDYDDFAGFFFEKRKVDNSILPENYRDYLLIAKEAIQSVEKWTIDNLNSALNDSVVAKGFKTGDFYMSLRIAVTGSRFTPPINESVIILGKKETLERIQLLLN